MAFMFAKRDALAHHQAFDLVKHRRVRDVVIVAIHAARRDQRERRLAGEHRADLHRRGMRAQQPAVGKIERVVHRARRMIGGDVERFEVVEVVFDLGPGGDFEAGLPEQLLDAQPHLGDRVQSAARFAAARQRDVDAFLRELRGDARLLELRALRLDRSLEFFAYAIEPRARFLALLGRKLAEILELLGQPAALAQRADAHFFERRHIGALEEMAPSVSARRASRSFGSSSAMAALRRLWRLSRLYRGLPCACFAMAANASG